MGFVKGQPRHPNAGRKPGSVNKKSLLKVGDLLASKDFHPVDKLMELLPELSPRDRAQVLLELMKYIEPTKKAVEVTEPVSEERGPEMIDVTDADLLQIANGKT